MNENLDLVTCLEWNSKQQNVLSVQRSSSVQQEVLAVEQVRKGLEKPEEEVEHFVKHRDLTCPVHVSLCVGFPNPSHSGGRLCSRCLASTTEDNSHLTQLLEITTFWSSEVTDYNV